MANRLFQQFFLSFTRNLVGLHGYVDIAADASVSGFSMKGVASVAKTATGTYTITLEDKYVALESAQFTVQKAVAADLVPQIASSDVSSAKTIVVRTLTGATATDPAAVTRIYMALRLRNSSVAN